MRYLGLFLSLALILNGSCEDDVTTPATEEKEEFVQIAANETLYQIVVEPLIFEFDRSQCNKTYSPAESCLCYEVTERTARKISRSLNRQSDNYCGNDKFASICASVGYKTRFSVYLNGHLANYKTATHATIPPFATFGKELLSTKRVGYHVHLKASDDCSVITASNLLLEQRDIAKDNDCGCTCGIKEDDDYHIDIYDDTTKAPVVTSQSVATTTELDPSSTVPASN